MRQYSLAVAGPCEAACYGDRCNVMPSDEETATTSSGCQPMRSVRAAGYSRLMATTLSQRQIISQQTLTSTEMWTHHSDSHLTTLDTGWAARCFHSDSHLTTLDTGQSSKVLPFWLSSNYTGYRLSSKVLPLWLSSNYTGYRQSSKVLPNCLPQALKYFI